jgi:hypothetical protein
MEDSVFYRVGAIFLGAAVLGFAAVLLAAPLSAMEGMDTLGEPVFDSSDSQAALKDLNSAHGTGTGLPYMQPLPPAPEIPMGSVIQFESLLGVRGLYAGNGLVLLLDPVPGAPTDRPIPIIDAVHLVRLEVIRRVQRGEYSAYVELPGGHERADFNPNNLDEVECPARFQAVKRMNAWFCIANDPLLPGR